MDLRDGRLRYARGATALRRPRHPTVRDEWDSAVGHRATDARDARDGTSRRPRPSETLRGPPRVATLARANIVPERARGRSAPRAWYASAAVARARSTRAVIAVKNQLADGRFPGHHRAPHSKTPRHRRFAGAGTRKNRPDRPTRVENEPLHQRSDKRAAPAHAVATSGDGRRTRWVRRSARGERDARRRGRSRRGSGARARGVARVGSVGTADEMNAVGSALRGLASGVAAKVAAMRGITRAGPSNVNVQRVKGQSAKKKVRVSEAPSPVAAPRPFHPRPANGFLRPRPRPRALLH